MYTSRGWRLKAAPGGCAATPAYAGSPHPRWRVKDAGLAAEGRAWRLRRHACLRRLGRTDANTGGHLRGAAAPRAAILSRQAKLRAPDTTAMQAGVGRTIGFPTGSRWGRLQR